MTGSKRKLVTASVAKFRDKRSAADKGPDGSALSLRQRQVRSRIDQGPSASLWTSQITIPAPIDSAVRDIVVAAVDALGIYEWASTSLQVSSVGAEWVGIKSDSRATVKKTLRNSQSDRYDTLMRDVRGSETIIYVHGGAFCLNGLGTSRPTAARLAKESGCRVLVLDYRLSPRSAFPAQILDLFILYLSLLSPPAGSYHSRIPASSIVIAAESAGASISLAFIQVLLYAKRQSTTLQFNGHRVGISNPAGVALLSCAGEHSQALPSWTINGEHDILRDRPPFPKPDFPADDIWPSEPPRADVYCSASLLTHPLVSPSLCKNWQGAPPLWFAVGQERFADSSALIAQTAARQGVCVLWNQYEALPHCWPLFLPKLSHSRDVMGKWGRVCRTMVDGGGLKSEGSWVTLEELEARNVDVKSLTDLTIEKAAAMVEEKAKTFVPYAGRKENDGPRL
ncbi:MAG: hypothetical protein Q9160_000597 [Pyrenula sp. 1 TL-2023]